MIQLAEDTIPGQLDAIKTRMAAAEKQNIGLDARMGSLEASMGGLREAVGYNTALTTEASGLTRQMAEKVDKLGVHLNLLGELQEKKTGQKWASRTLRGAGGIAAAMTAIGAAAAGIWHFFGGKQ
jgi:hypothetical protein